MSFSVSDSNTKVKEMTCFEFRNSRSVGFDMVNCIKVPDMTTGSDHRSMYYLIDGKSIFIFLSPNRTPESHLRGVC